MTNIPKQFYTRDNIGKAKYTINFHDGKDTHKDGSPFFGILIFRNKKKYNQKISQMKKEGYLQTN